MPIVTFNLVRGRHSDPAIKSLLVEASETYVDIFYPDIQPRPIERARAFVNLIEPQYWATGGALVSDGGADAPFFTFLALAGRPDEQLHAVIEAFTELCVKHLDCERHTVRGQAITIDPSHWGIAGAPASKTRKSEIEKRG